MCYKCHSEAVVEQPSSTEIYEDNPVYAAFALRHVIAVYKNVATL